MLEVSLPFYRQRTCAMPLESELLTKESLEHGKAPSWKDLPESIGNWNLCGVNRVELLGKRPELAERPHIFRHNIFGDMRCITYLQGPSPGFEAAAVNPDHGRRRQRSGRLPMYRRQCQRFPHPHRDLECATGRGRPRRFPLRGRFK